MLLYYVKTTAMNSRYARPASCLNIVIIFVAQDGLVHVAKRNNIKLWLQPRYVLDSTNP